VYAATKDAAATKLREALGRRDRGVVEAPARETVGSFLESWLEGLPATVRPRTAASYRQLTRQHLVPALGRVRLGRLRPQHVQALYARMLESGLSAKTVRNAHGVLHRALSQAVRWGLLHGNVADAVDAPRRVPVEMAALDSAEVRALLEAAAADPLGALWTLAVLCGLRQGELLAVRWPEVDLEAGTLRVTASMVRVAGEPVLRAEPKSHRSRRQVELPALAVDALRRHRQAARVLDPRGYVFTAADGGPLSASTAQKSWRRFRDAAGLPPVRFHDLRHSAASLMLAQGVPVRTVADALGHDPAVTLRVYAHVTPAMRRQTAAVMDDLFG
jgi:integrase